MKKYLYLIVIVISTGVIIYLNKFNTNNSSNKEIKNFTFSRNITDTFNPINSKSLLKFNNSIYKVSSTKDTLNFLDERNSIYSFNSLTDRILSNNKLHQKPEYLFLKITGNDTVLYDRKKKIFTDSKFNILTFFDNDIDAIEEINDTSYLFKISHRDKKSYLSTYNIHTKIFANNFDLMSHFGKVDTETSKESDYITMGDFCRNSNYIYYLFLYTGNIVKYDINKQNYAVFYTIDSTDVPELIKKEFSYKGQTIVYNTFKNETFSNLSITANDKYLFVLSNVSQDKNIKYIDVYDANNIQYLSSIKIYNDQESDAEPFHIILNKNKLYILYNNEKLYCKIIHI